MKVKDFKKILDDYEDECVVIGINWANGEEFDVTIGGDDEDEGTKFCRIGFN